MSFIYYMYVCKHAGSLVVARPNAVRAIDAARTQPQPPNQQALGFEYKLTAKRTTDIIQNCDTISWKSNAHIFSNEWIFELRVDYVVNTSERKFIPGRLSNPSYCITQFATKILRDDDGIKLATSSQPTALTTIAQFDFIS